MQPGKTGAVVLTLWFQSQISVLQNRIEQLEQLLEENHQIISHIKDSVLELTENGGGVPGAQLPFRNPNGSWNFPFDGQPTFLSISPQDCQFALGSRRQKTDMQVSERAEAEAEAVLWGRCGLQLMQTLL